MRSVVAQALAVSPRLLSAWATGEDSLRRSSRAVALSVASDNDAGERGPCAGVVPSPRGDSTEAQPTIVTVNQIAAVRTGEA